MTTDTNQLKLQKSIEELDNFQKEIIKLSSKRATATNNIANTCFSIIAKFNTCWNAVLSKTLKPKFDEMLLPAFIRADLIKNMESLIPINNCVNNQIVDSDSYATHLQACEHDRAGRISSHFRGDIHAEVLNNIVSIDFHPRDDDDDLEDYEFNFTVPVWIIDLYECDALDYPQITKYIIDTVVTPTFDSIDLSVYQQTTDPAFMFELVRKLSPENAVRAIDYIKSLK